MTCIDRDTDRIDVDAVTDLPPELRVTMTDLFAIANMAGIESRPLIEGALGFLEDIRSGNS